MDVNDILKQHRAWQEKISKTDTRKIDPSEVAKMPLDLKRQRIAEYKTKIDQLARRKEELVKSYDAAIAQHKTAMEGLERDLAGSEDLFKKADLQGAAADDSARTRKTRKTRK
jgi:hypothetical protein